MKQLNRLRVKRIATSQIDQVFGGTVGVRLVPDGLWGPGVEYIKDAEHAPPRYVLEERDTLASKPYAIGEGNDKLWVQPDGGYLQNNADRSVTVFRGDDDAGTWRQTTVLPDGQGLVVERGVGDGTVEHYERGADGNVVRNYFKMEDNGDDPEARAYGNLSPTPADPQEQTEGVNLDEELQ